MSCCRQWCFSKGKSLQWMRRSLKPCLLPIIGSPKRQFQLCVGKCSRSTCIFTPVSNNTGVKMHHYSPTLTESKHGPENYCCGSTICTIIRSKVIFQIIFDPKIIWKMKKYVLCTSKVPHIIRFHVCIKIIQ